LSDKTITERMDEAWDALMEFFGLIMAGLIVGGIYYMFGSIIIQEWFR